MNLSKATKEALQQEGDSPPFADVDDSSSSLDDVEHEDIKAPAAKEEEEQKDAPEALVRKENSAVSVTRIFLFIILVVAAAVTALLILHFTSSAEQESFESDFDGVATKIVEGMKSDASLRLWMARSLANTVTMAMEISEDTTALNLTLPPSRWEKVTQEARFNGNAMIVSWSPWLSNDDDRKAFEEYAKPQEFTIGSNPQCFLCGSSNQTYENPLDLAEMTGFGLVPCGGMEKIGRQGVLPPENCGLIAQMLSKSCNCVDLPPGTKVPTRSVNKPDEIFEVFQTGPLPVPEERGPYSPIWQALTVSEVTQLPIMYNQMSEPNRADALRAMQQTSMPVMSKMFPREGPFYEQYLGNVGYTTSILYYPVFDPTDQYIVGSVGIELFWENFATGVFPPNSQYVDMVVENTCGQNYTYKIDHMSNAFVLVGEGDFHDKTFEDDMFRATTFKEYEDIVDFAAPISKDQSTLDYCRYRYIVYPTQELEDLHLSSDPYIYASIVAAIFVFTSFVFLLYDLIVSRRQAKVMASAKRTNDIVASLFPQNVRDRLYEEAREKEAAEAAAKKKSAFVPSKKQMQTFLNNDKQEESVFGSEPIADLFPHATVMFLDLVNFTAWSSEREPSQVFKLLETIYHAFDKVAKAMGVFKVETIGDSYVAVCGLPEPRRNHAVVMAMFARHCLKRMRKLTKELEMQLGPSTGDLKARVGLHSGSVTAGVLRGEKARFQLFGDTVNMASRLESTSAQSRIHCSKQTMQLIVAAGKEDWVEPRDDKVSLKGKGEMETFWLNPRSNTGSVGTIEMANSDAGDEFLDGATTAQRAAKTARLVDWNVEVLYSLLEKVVASRDPSSSKENLAAAEQKLLTYKQGKIVIDELTQILELPKFSEDVVRKHSDQEIAPCVKLQLHDFISTIANLYRDVPFHNFDHASHVIMSAGKLMKRIITPDGIDYDLDGVQDKEIAIARQIHQVTYGLSSDPLMQFSAVFSALIHDVDHTGLTNAELVKMTTPASVAYRQKSVAEQNSVDVAWVVLMDDKYKDLRACIYTNKTELARFRQFLVNAVMATDIADKELKTRRESRWADAFSESARTSCQKDIDRRATIVFEYIIQASDIAHTMQHWHTYQKFNARLFEERYLAWVKGRAGEKDPSVGWYGGEIWFFENYIIPCAHKLDKCGVFGVSYEEYLNYALENRREWEEKGHGIVAEMLAKCQAKYGSEINPDLFESY